MKKVKRLVLILLVISLFSFLVEANRSAPTECAVVAIDEGSGEIIFRSVTPAEMTDKELSILIQKELRAAPRL